MKRRGGTLAAVIVVLAVAGCTTLMPSAPVVSVPAFEFPVDCGPIDAAKCHSAVEMAATAKLNPPPIAAASIRLPRADDDCTTAFHECGPGSVIVLIQSGDTIQDVPLIPALGGGWVRLDQVR